MERGYEELQNGTMASSIECSAKELFKKINMQHLEIRRLGGLITPACSYMLSYEFLCPTQSDLGFACLCIVLYSRLWALPAGLPW